MIGKKKSKNIKNKIEPKTVNIIQKYIEQLSSLTDQTTNNDPMIQTTNLEKFF